MVAFGARSAPDAYRHCEEVVRRSDSSFASAFWLLPGDQRRAIHAIYAFCRLADDIADDPALQGDRRKLLARWRCELEAAYRGKAEHPVGIALGDTVHRFALPEALFAELLDGVEFDLSGAEIEFGGRRSFPGNGYLETLANLGQVAAETLNQLGTEEISINGFLPAAGDL